MDARAVAEARRLSPHLEGGFHRETYRCALTVTPPGWPGDRSLATPQVLVPAGEWQSATPAGGAPGWSLVACVVAPGFDFADFELG